MDRDRSRTPRVTGSRGGDGPILKEEPARPAVSTAAAGLGAPLRGGAVRTVVPGVPGVGSGTQLSRVWQGSGGGAPGGPEPATPRTAPVAPRRLGAGTER